MRCRYAAPDRPLALRSLLALLSLTLTRSDWVRTDTEENPRLQQIFDDVIFAGLEMEANVDICVTSAQFGRQSLCLSLVLSLTSLCLSISHSSLYVCSVIMLPGKSLNFYTSGRLKHYSG